jgi:hypothetical protein
MIYNSTNIYNTNNYLSLHISERKRFTTYTDIL